MSRYSRVRTVLLVSLLASACGPQTRYFRILVSADQLGSSGGQRLPDSCYRDASLPNPTTPEQQMAQSFCQVPTKPTQTSGSTTNAMFLSESWSLVDVSASEAYLIRSQSVGSSATYRIGYGGKRVQRGYEFAAGTSNWVEACPSGGPTGCTTPTHLSRSSNATIAMELNASDVRGVMSQITSYACESGACASDFAQRCPSCTIATQIVGIETTESVQEMELR